MDDLEIKIFQEPPGVLTPHLCWVGRAEHRGHAGGGGQVGHPGDPAGVALDGAVTTQASLTFKQQ